MLGGLGFCGHPPLRDIRRVRHDCIEVPAQSLKGTERIAVYEVHAVCFAVNAGPGLGMFRKLHCRHQGIIRQGIFYCSCNRARTGTQINNPQAPLGVRSECVKCLFHQQLRLGPGHEHSRTNPHLDTVKRRHTRNMLQGYAAGTAGDKRLIPLHILRGESVPQKRPLLHRAARVPLTGGTAPVTFGIGTQQMRR